VAVTNLFALAVAMLLRVSPWLAVDETRLIELATPIAAVSSSARDVADLVAVGYFESGKAWDGTRIGDHGHTVSVWAVWTCPGDDCLPSQVDPEYAARVALTRIRSSERDCASLRGGDRWSEYTSGRCMRNPHARHRWRLARRLERDVHVEVVVEEEEEGTDA